MEGRSLQIFTAVQIVAIAIILWIVFSIPGACDLQRIIGTALMLVGIGGIVTARFQLGKSFAIRAKAHQLVTHGIYSKIRNPIYVFGVVVLVGFVLVLHRPVLWLVVLAVVIMQTVRARREAKILEAAFGDAYREYRRKTWF
ncbi:MAG: isoprenylcysteine carboxylmethyltransferase family protein [Candidatus Sulfotelmatobacter sp.]